MKMLLFFAVLSDYNESIEMARNLKFNLIIIMK